MKNIFLSQDFLKECLRYDPESGDLSWLIRPRHHFRSVRSQNSWNAKHFEKLANSVRPDGYISVRLMNTGWLAHRLAYLYMTGEFPSESTDHINGDRADNRWINLRDVDAGGNARNASRRADNKSGRVGVCAFNGGWLANINYKNNRHYLGLFSTRQDAISARENAEVKFGYHENHGRSK